MSLERGRILVADENGVYDIKMTGDVRMVLCASLDRYIESVFRNGDATEVLVDLLDASGVDSTTLGLLAKLGIYANRQFGIKPKLFCIDEGIYRTLCVMSLDEVFDLRREQPGVTLDVMELECGDEDPQAYKQRVLEAHKLLVELNPNNRADFIDLIRALESE